MISITGDDIIFNHEPFKSSQSHIHLVQKATIRQQKTDKRLNNNIEAASNSGTKHLSASSSW
jgi:hypothetical protein